jgi:YVTN family beta-propeller protein
MERCAHAFVANDVAGTVSVIATSDDSVATISPGGSPYGVSAARKDR